MNIPLSLAKTIVIYKLVPLLCLYRVSVKEGYININELCKFLLVRPKWVNSKLYIHSFNRQFVCFTQKVRLLWDMSIFL